MVPSSNETGTANYDESLLTFTSIKEHGVLKNSWTIIRIGYPSVRSESSASIGFLMNL